MAETSAQGGSGAGVVLETRNGDTQDVASSVDVSSADSSTERPLHPALAVVETFWDEMPYEDDWHMCLAQDVTFKMHVIVDPWGRKGDPEEVSIISAEGKDAVMKAFMDHGKGLSKKLWQADMGKCFEIEKAEGDVNADKGGSTTHLVRRGKEQFGHRKPNVPVHWNIEWRFILEEKMIRAYIMTKTPVKAGAAEEKNQAPAEV